MLNSDQMVTIVFAHARAERGDATMADAVTLATEIARRADTLAYNAEALHLTHEGVTFQRGAHALRDMVSALATRDMSVVEFLARRPVAIDLANGLNDAANHFAPLMYGHEGGANAALLARYMSALRLMLTLPTAPAEWA